MWTLAPPESHLIFPSRVPFEESTIWGRAEDVATIDGAKVFILKPGDMLIIPPKWWHTTRSLDLSISVNIWNKLPKIDEKSRESEAATRILSEIARCSELISIPTLESGSFGAINRLTDFIESPISSEGIREIIEGDKIYHALTHPKTVRAFLDAYKNLN